MPFTKRLAPVLLALPLVLWLAACADKSSGGGGGSGTGGESSYVCPKTLAAACAPGEPPGQFGVSCADTWTLALADTHYCGTGIVEKQADCGTYLARIVINVDVADSYYYEKATGALVAVLGSGYNGSVECFGGPSTFVLPACSAEQPLAHCPADGGTD